MTLPAPAQSWVQLLEQLHRLGWRHEALLALRDAYQLAIALFAGQYRASGVPFPDHLVRTASIVAEAGGSPAVVAAALLHSAYTHGDFGGTRQGADRAHRARVRGAVGPDAERLIACYGRTATSLLRAILAGSSPPVDDCPSEVVLLVLANELEEHMDWGRWASRKALACASPDQDLKHLEDAAHRSGLTTLARRFTALRGMHAGAPPWLDAALLDSGMLDAAGAIHFAGRDSSFRLLPRSARLRWHAALRVRSRPVRSALRAWIAGWTKR